MNADSDADAGSPEWAALADPTRRKILDLLSTGPANTGTIASNFEISRVAVMKHLDVLASAGLVISRKRGRERWHYVNLAPVMRLHERWAAPGAATMAAALLTFKTKLERPVAELATIDLSFEVEIAAEPAVVFTALTEDVGAWWGAPFVTSDATGLAIEPDLGGRFIERYGATDGRILAEVSALRTNRLLQLTGPFHLGAATAVAEISLEPTAADTTTLALSFRGAGLISDDLVEAFNGGWRELLTVRLKSYVESGTRLGIDPG